MRAWLLVPLMVAGAVSLAAAQVTVVKTLPGQNAPTSGWYAEMSADMMGGVSPKYLVGFINGGFTVRSKSDGREIQPGQSLPEFWSAAFKNAGRELVGNPYDPRIFYDPLTSRWFASCNLMMVDGRKNTNTSRILLAVSGDDDPTHPWKAVDYQVPMIIDNLKLGLDKNGVYLTSLVWVDEKTVPMIAIPKADLLWKGPAAPSLAHLNYFDAAKAAPEATLGSRGGRGDEGMVPAFDLDPDKKPGDPMIYVNRFQASLTSGTAIQIRKVTWTTPTTATMTGPFTIPLGVIHPAPTTQAAQPPLAEKGLISPPIRPGGGRLVNAVSRHGSLWTIGATDVHGRTGAFWVQIDPNALTVIQHGLLGDSAGDIVFASLNVDANGSVGMAMNRSSASDYLSISVTGRLASDPPNTLRPLVKAVAGRYVFIPAGWDLSSAGKGTGYSDFSTVVMDPSDPTLFWSYQEVPTNTCLPVEKNGGRYGTAWVAFRVAPPGWKPPR